SEVRVFMRLGGAWKEVFSVPYTENTWPVKEDEFVACYALGENIYGSREFNPSLSSTLYAATRKGEYGWINEEVGIGGLLETSEFSGDNPAFGQFLAFAYMLSLGHVARIKERAMRVPEFYANVPYMLVKAGVEKNKGNGQESLFLLRSVCDLSLVSLRFSPLGGRMLQLRRYFDMRENLMNRKFALSASVLKMLSAMGLRKGGPVILTKGDFSAKGGKTYMTFGALLWAMKAASIKGARWKGPVFWSALKSQNAKLFAASYWKEDTLDLLDEETQLARGSDIIKVEEFFSKLTVRRVMVQESGRAKEIKAQLAKAIELADGCSTEKNAFLDRPGSCGEAVYETAAKGRKAALALLSSKRYY
ncbi:MAG: hypothetical protein PHS02_01945, partial [Candidatus ainarchaeum sp.]|nr:hypothetical protein [Candidatus ainarchaeum sp.]